MFILIDCETVVRSSWGQARHSGRWPAILSNSNQRHFKVDDLVSRDSPPSRRRWQHNERTSTNPALNRYGRSRFARGEGSDWRTPRWLRLTAMDLGAEIATRNAVDQCMT